MPTAVSTPAFRVPSRILRTTSGSSPATPPGYRRTITLPPESVFHFSAVSLRMRCHEEPSGTRVAILTRTGCAAAGPGTSPHVRRPSNRARDHPVVFTIRSSFHKKLVFVFQEPARALLIDQVDQAQVLHLVRVH